MKVAILCASYNRVDTTLRGITGLFAAIDEIPDVKARLFLLDDASPDGTGSILRKAFPSAHVIDGSGNLFWNRGMRAAYQLARLNGPWDAYLLFNDDTLIIPSSVKYLFDTFHSNNAVSVTACVGKLTSLDKGQKTYGGFVRAGGFSPLSLLASADSRRDQNCDTFNGNFVLIPAIEFEAVDPFPNVFHHQYGDLDIGFRLVRRGVKILECAHPVGHADRNPPLDNSTIRKRWRNTAVSPNGLGQYIAFVRRNCPFPAWPIIVFIGLAGRLGRIFFGNLGRGS